VKIAPFDEVTPATATLARAAKGLERISEVSAVLTSDVSLYVDCHWRFTPEVAAEIIAPLQECGVTWYECPIAETGEHLADLRRLRHLANNAGMVLAGLEQGIGSAQFETFARAGAYDIMMPDIKYIGGIDVMVETADILTRHGVTLSPHNPTGPILRSAGQLQIGTADFRTRQRSN
jgi:galactonate dehydratase